MSYRLSEKAKVRFTIQRALAGRVRRVKGRRRCVRPTRKLVKNKARRCTRYKRAGRLTRNGKAGANSFKFTGRIGRKALRAGRYRIRARATDPAGNASRTRTVRFRIVGR